MDSNCGVNAGQIDKITREADESSTMGQTESKRNGKQISAVHTKTATTTGTRTSAGKGSMSFGFKKGSGKTTATLKQKEPTPDSNGNNSDSLAEEVSGTKPTSRLIAPRKEQSGQSYRSNRFGFRHANSVRPTSTGLEPKVSEFEDPNNNYSIDTKPRSKSALGRAPTTTTTDRYNNNNNNATIRQNTMSDMKTTRAMNAPLIAKPPLKTSSVDSIGSQGRKTTTKISIKLASHSIDTTAAAGDKDCSKDTVKKFTLQTSNLPRAEYAVPVSVRTTRMELKNVKQSLNNSRREFLGLNAQNEPVTTAGNPYQNAHSGLQRQQRNLELVLNGRHKFEVRDLEDSLREETVVVPLALPKLPSAFDTASSTRTVPNGLVRQEPMRAMDSQPSPQKESIEEEKLLIDSQCTEKSGKSTSSKQSVENTTTEEAEEEEAKTMADSITMKSINTSWSIAGESMVHESQLSTEHKNTCSQVLDLYSEEATLNAASITAEDSTAKPSVAEDTDNEVTLNDVQLIDDDEATMNEPFVSELEKYANNNNDPLLEDETSPSVSLLTSNSKENPLGDIVKESAAVEEVEDLLEETPEPENINKSPTHTSHSNSLSEQGRDFLIDDEIADQPGLFSNYKNDSEASELPKASPNEKALVKASPLLKHREDVTKNVSPLFLHKSPLMKLRKVQRSESLDTLSPCDSIASDDLMMDFESQSSFESIDRIGSTLRDEKENPPAQDNELQLWRELEQQSGELFREWKTILNTATVTNIRNTPATPSPPLPHGPSPFNSGKSSAVAVVPPSNIPARGTRLLNRSRIQGVDSPRSVESIPRPRRSSSLTKTPSPLQATTTQAKGSSAHSGITSDDLILSRSTRNTMIQDVLYFKKQLLRLRRLLQEDEDILKRTDTLNPFEVNGNVSSLTSRHLSLYESMDKSNGTPVGGGDDNSSPESGNWTEVTQEVDDVNNNLSQSQELIDLRRQVVYLQSQLDENSRTIRIQKNLITKYETEKQQQSQHSSVVKSPKRASATVATQTERMRPVSQSRINGISSRIEANGHSTVAVKSRSRSIGIPLANRNGHSGKQPISLINGLGIDTEDSNKRRNYAENLLLQNNNNRNRMSLLSSTPPSSQLRGQIYLKKSSMDDLLNIKHLAESPPKYISTSTETAPLSRASRRVPISRISLKYLRPSLASSTNSLSSVNHSMASSTSSLSDNNHSSSKPCLKVDT